MESKVPIELRYPDGRVVKGEFADFASGHLAKGTKIGHDGRIWLMYDREDRDGVTLHLFSPEAQHASDASRARTRRR
jgi:hypothetical protein